MRILVAPNSFKNCLDAASVGAAIKRGILEADPRAIVEIIPMSDGGDGLLAVAEKLLPGRRLETPTVDALRRPLQAAWLLTPQFALIEMALASGLARLKGPAEYDPLKACTFGTGLLLRAALDQGCRHIVIGLGGSATVDAGCGMATALGFRLLDAADQPLNPGGGFLGALQRILTDQADARIKETQFTFLLDVANPLLGACGAARVFAPQKGADPEEVEQLEINLANWARIAKRDLNADVAALPGGGAAGGAGAGGAAFFRATLEPGAAWVARQAQLEEAVRRAELVITGEGRIDNQTAFGKVPAYVASMAHKHGKPVAAIGGAVAANTDLSGIGITRCLAATPAHTPWPQALRDAEKNLASAARLIMLA